MKELYLLDDSIISPLGFSTSENLSGIKNEISGLKYHKSPKFKSGGFYASIIEKEFLRNLFAKIGDPSAYTKLEQMMLLALHDVLQRNPELKTAETALIISTTKGNIDLLQEKNDFPEERVYLHELGRILKDFFGFSMEPVIVSNACVSGGLALAVAKRFIDVGKYENAIVVGGDLVSDFVVSGFQSFQAISEEPCKPFSKDRNGISLGEGAAAILVSGNSAGFSGKVSITGVATANDANHISGPSRNGEGLFLSIEKAIKEAEIPKEKIGYISAHGTATEYNDSMEAVAINRSGLNQVPLNSFKGYYGHTLGTSALIESILTKRSLLNNELYTSLNFNEPGTAKPLNLIKEQKKENLNYALKTASGFGGCNLALVFKKEENAV